jgi:glyoxylase-like metal-dependent hydrolase (beta-lactamase superfamily II)
MEKCHMNLLEQQLTYPHNEQLPAAGAAMEVAPGVHWLRMGLPFALDHINLWLLADEAQQGPAWSIVDCGVDNAATRANWEAVFARHCGKAPVTRVLATHCHPDHVGLADWLCARWQAPLAMTAAEYAFARLMAASLPGADGTAAVAHFQLHGLTDQAMIAQLQGRKSYYPNLVPALPHAYQRLQDGDMVRIGGRQWRVITGFGHSPEHVALYCKQLGVLISGDMILPRISTNVSVFAIEPQANPLRAFLVSLSKFADLPEDTLVLPSHGRPFRGLHTRIAQLRAHHLSRLADVLDACAAPQSAADIVPMMFERALDAHQLSFALGEALAHLHLLWFEGKLQRQTGTDGIIRFVT